MKKQIAVALMAAAMAAGQCYAQRPTSKADIPFAFQVANQTMPAGEYLIQRVSDTNRRAEMIRRTDSSAAVIALTFSVVDAKNGGSEPKLVFHKYGDSYFLSEIWTGRAEGRHLLVSKREKELARETPGSEVAVSLQPVSERGL
jgi:hypothetical protein